MAKQMLENCPSLPDSHIARDCIWQHQAANVGSAATTLSIFAEYTSMFPAITLDGRADIPTSHSGELEGRRNVELLGNCFAMPALLVAKALTSGTV